MRDAMKMKLTALDSHRNGISGEGFYVVLFDWTDEDGTRRHMQAVVFDERGYCAVFDVDELAKGNIAFAQGNSWRGDHFEPQCRKWIIESTESETVAEDKGAL